MLAAVFVLITVRQVGRFTLQIWQVMLCGALAVLLSGQISLSDALVSINADVMVFLFGMFVVGEALVQSGYLECIAHRLFSHTQNPAELVFVLFLSMGFLSALLMNDTLAIIGTPLVLVLARRHNLSKKMLLLALALAITTGSVMSPIGNPQNLLIAMASGMPSPFITFAYHLILPTLISLIAAFFMVRLFYPGDFSARPLDHGAPVACDNRAMRICQFSLAVIVTLILANAALSLSGSAPFITLPIVALCGAAPVLVLSPHRGEIVRCIDWCTLVFFAAMFILMAAVWRSGFFQSLAGAGMVSSVPVILATSIIISQFISNVPFVALFQPVILGAGGTTAQVLALAAGSTIAGNLTILGAASNVIIIQNAEKQGETITFTEFAKIGIPLTLLQAAVYWVFLGFP